MAEEAVAAAPKSPGTEPAQVILVVEDEQGLRQVMTRTLREEGFRTLEAAHGGEALELMDAAVDPVDLVVTDVVMPGMDGRELGRRLGQRWPAIPILYISAYDVNDIFSRGSPRTSAPFLQKPFPLNGLVTAIRGLLKTPSPQ